MPTAAGGRNPIPVPPKTSLANTTPNDMPSAT